MLLRFLPLFLFLPLSLLAQQDSDNQTVVRDRPETKMQPPQIYLLRGLSREHSHWSEEFLEALTTQFKGGNYTFMDLPGAGDYHDERAMMSVVKMAEFLHETHADSLAAHRGNNILLATSLGGIVALEWLDRYPEDFDGVIMVSSGFKGICKGSERVRPGAKLTTLSILLTGKMPKREQKLLNINSNFHQKDTVLLNEWIAIQEERPITRGAMIKQGLGGMFYKPKKKKVVVPMLILGSYGDQLVHPDCICDVADWFKGEMAFHHSAGHGIPIDAPQWIVEVSSEWWERQLALKRAGAEKKIIEQGDGKP